MLGNGGYDWYFRRPLDTGDPNRAQLAGLEMRNRRSRRREGQVHQTTNQVGVVLGHTLVGHMSHLDTGTHLEKLAEQVI